MTKFQRISFLFFIASCMLTGGYLIGKWQAQNIRAEHLAKEAELYGNLKSCAVALNTAPTNAEDASILLMDTVLPLARQTAFGIKARFVLNEIATPEEVVAEFVKCRATASALQDLIVKLKDKELAEKRIATLARIQTLLKTISNEWGYYKLPPINVLAMRTRLPCITAREIASLRTDIRSYPDPIWQQVMAVEPWNRRIDDCLY